MGHVVEHQPQRYPLFGAAQAVQSAADLGVTHDRSVSLGQIEEKFDTLIREYGETRETEGFLNGMRAATHAPNGDVRPLRTVPPPIER